MGSPSTSRLSALFRRTGRIRAVIHASGKVAWQKRYARLFERGLRRHGIETRIASSKRPRRGDFAVLFGPNYWVDLEQRGEPYLMVNRCFLGDHLDNLAIGWNGLNGRAQYCVEAIDPARWQRWISPSDLQPWRDTGDYLLLCGQADLGRCDRYPGLKEWYEEIRTSTREEIVFRAWPGPRESVPLESQLSRAKLAVTLNSTVSVKTLIAGVPTITMDAGNPAHAICGHTLEAVRRPERIPFLQYLAHCQWHFTEIEDGSFWEQLKARRGPRLFEWQPPTP